MTSSTKKSINTLIKVTILLCATFFIYQRLSDNANLNNFEQLVHKLSRTKVYLVLSMVFLLMLVNWLIEAVKWRFLIKPIQKISLWRAIESVFCGLTIAVFTPNRIGEYGGRVFFLPSRKRIFGAIAMGVGAVAQMVVTNVLGAVSIFWFLASYIKMNFWLYYGLSLFVFIYCLFFLILYFNISFLQSLLRRIQFLKGFRRFFGILARYHSKELLLTFFYSLLRFAVFTSQYCLVIKLLIPELAVFQMAMMIFILFFIQSALPSLDLLDVGVRTMTATYFFSFITKNDVAIMAATASIWFVNLIIPAILGSVFVLKLNVFDIKRP